MWLAATVPAAANQRFLVSDRERATWADLYRSVADAVGVPTAEIHTVERDEVLAHLAASSGLSARIKRQLKSGGGKRLVDAIPREAKSRVRRMQAAWRPPAAGADPADVTSCGRCRTSNSSYRSATISCRSPSRTDPRVRPDPVRRGHPSERAAWLAAMGFHAQQDLVGA